MRNEKNQGTNLCFWCLSFDDKSYGIIDFKTTNLKDDKAESYRYQLEAYRYIFTYPGSIKKGPTPKLSPITHMGVLQFEPKSISNHEENNCTLNLEMSYSKLKQDDKKFFNRIRPCCLVGYAVGIPPQKQRHRNGNIRQVAHISFNSFLCILSNYIDLFYFRILYP